MKTKIYTSKNKDISIYELYKRLGEKKRMYVRVGILIGIGIFLLISVKLYASYQEDCLRMNREFIKITRWDNMVGYSESLPPPIQKGKVQKMIFEKKQIANPISKNKSWKQINKSCTPPVGAKQEEMKKYVYTVAEQNGISGKFLWEMLRRESTWRWCAVGDFHVSKPSVGIAQINLRWNPAVTKEQALYWKWSVKWTARELKNGKVRKWTTGRAMILEGWKVVP